VFTPEHVHQFRKRVPGVKIIVHPECPMDVVDLADEVGSTEKIIKTIDAAPAGTAWAVGTEVNLVNRLTHTYTDKRVQYLSGLVCMCATMYRIDLVHLAWTLENLVQGCVVNQVRVTPEVAEGAKAALDRMLAIV
jgi:quinolinate synthase